VQKKAASVQQNGLGDDDDNESDEQLEKEAQEAERQLSGGVDEAQQERNNNAKVKAFLAEDGHNDGSSSKSSDDAGADSEATAALEKQCTSICNDAGCQVDDCVKKMAACKNNDGCEDGVADQLSGDS